MRSSKVTTNKDRAGEYQVEIFDAEKPKSVVICSHGNGVRRWDGENFFYNVANNYVTRAFYLVDQNQVIEGGCRLNDLSIMIARVQSLIELAKQDYAGVPIIVMGHSMGCGVAARLDLKDVSKVVFVAPATGRGADKLIERYGADVADGKMVKTKDGLNKYIPKEYFLSVKDVEWEEDYKKLLSHYKNVYVFESGDEEIVGEERFTHRSMPFAGYKIIPGATHDYSGEALQKLFKELDSLL